MAQLLAAVGALKLVVNLEALTSSPHPQPAKSRPAQVSRDVALGSRSVRMSFLSLTPQSPEINTNGSALSALTPSCS